MLYRNALLCLIIIMSSLACLGQEAGDIDSVMHIPDKLGASIDRKISSLDKKLTRKSEKYLKDFARQEEKLLKVLAATDSSAAAQMLRSGRATYQKLSGKLSDAGNQTERILSGEYIPLLDSLQGSLGFLQDAKNIVSRSKDIQQQLGKSLEQVNRFQHRLSAAKDIQKAIGDRQRQLQQLLSGYTRLPKDAGKYLGKYQQQAFYYGQQVREYRAMLNDPDKLIAKTLSVLQNLPAFQQYMRKYSMLAQLFPTPENYGTPQALAGLQTRTSVQQQMQQAQGELNKLKEELNKLGITEGGSSDMPMADF